MQMEERSLNSRTRDFARTARCSADSQKAYFSIGSEVNVSLWSIPVAGGTPTELVKPVNYAAAAVSHDGTRVALFAVREQKLCAIVANLATGQYSHHFSSIRVWRALQSFLRTDTL
jgi:hypothetical protein